MKKSIMGRFEPKSLCRVRAAAAALLCVIAAWSFTWPTYRAFLNIEIDRNEGWNAYWADAAMGRMPLYPPSNQLITNNYPPLSFYIIGAFGRLIGDPMLAGRLLSLVAVVFSAVAIALAIRWLGGNRASAGIGAIYFVASMSRFSDGYVGMNDPQLLAQAVMVFGFLAFLSATERDRGYMAPIFVMVVAGFIKQNIIAMPLTAYVWLAVRRPHRMVNSVALGAGAVAIGFAVCFAIFGPDFFTNMLCPRSYSFRSALGAVRDLRPVAVGLAAWAYVGWTRRTDSDVQLCNLFMGIALAAFFLQKTGAGVDCNAQFDLVIAVSICVGLAFAHAPFLPLARRFGPEVLQIALLAAICVLLVGRSFRHSRSVRLVFDPSFQMEIAVREKAMVESVARVRATPGDVYSSLFVCYRSGKPFAIDDFNANERIKGGTLPQDAINGRVIRGTLTVVEADPLSWWGARLIQRQ
jgi:hypothetical protein